MLGMFLLIELVLVILGIAWWVWALVDIIKSKFKDDTTKIIWILVIIFLPLIGLLIYSVVGKTTKLVE